MRQIYGVWLARGEVCLRRVVSSYGGDLGMKKPGFVGRALVVKRALVAGVVEQAAGPVAFAAQNVERRLEAWRRKPRLATKGNDR